MLNKKIFLLFFNKQKHTEDVYFRHNISSFCHLNQEPIFVTKDGQGDLAIMSIEKYEEILDTAEFYKKICDGLNDLRNGRARPYSEFREEILNV